MLYQIQNKKGNDFMSNDDFDCVVDPVYRKPNEWARIYNIHLIDRADNICSEYEWAWNMTNKYKYYPLPDIQEDGSFDFDSFDKSNEFEGRAQDIARNIYIHADVGEKSLIDKDMNYVETNWVKHNLKLL
jgi:hypothetical protein